MSENLALDTSACFALLDDEPGADVVESTLLDARAGLASVHVCFITLTEVEYIVTQEHSAEAAAKAIAKLLAWPARWHHSDDALCSAAAKLKAAHKISFADSFVAALAKRLDATLIHKDPEFAALGNELKQRMLPAKTGPME